MGLFHRSSNELVSAASIQDAQRQGPDVKAGADSFITNQIHAANLDNGRHLWHSPEVVQIMLAQAAVAFCADYIGETLLATGTNNRKGDLVVAPDVALFAGNLTDWAADKMQEVNRLQQAYTEGMDDEGWEYDTDNRNALYPDNQLPWWPVDAPGANFLEEAWQSDDAGIVSPALVRGITSSGMGLYLETETSLGALPQELVAATPPELDGTYTVLSGLLNGTQDAGGEVTDVGAFVRLSQASELMGTEGKVSPDTLANAYRLAHDGLVLVMTANMGLVAPPQLGEGFRNGQ